MWLASFAVLLTAEASLDDFTLQAPLLRRNWRDSAQLADALPCSTARARRRRPLVVSAAALRLLRRALGGAAGLFDAEVPRGGHRFDVVAYWRPYGAAAADADEPLVPLRDRRRPSPTTLPCASRSHRRSSR